MRAGYSFHTVAGSGGTGCHGLFRARPGRHGVLMLLLQARARLRARSFLWQTAHVQVPCCCEAISVSRQHPRRSPSGHRLQGEAAASQLSSTAWRPGCQSLAQRCAAPAPRRSRAGAAPACSGCAAAPALQPQRGCWQRAQQARLWGSRERLEKQALRSTPVRIANRTAHRRSCSSAVGLARTSALHAPRCSAASKQGVLHAARCRCRRGRGRHGRRHALAPCRR